MYIVSILVLDILFVCRFHHSAVFLHNLRIAFNTVLGFPIVILFPSWCRVYNLYIVSIMLQGLQFVLHGTGFHISGTLFPLLNRVSDFYLVSTLIQGFKLVYRFHHCAGFQFVYLFYHVCNYMLFHGKIYVSITVVWLPHNLHKDLKLEVIISYKK